MAKSETTRVVFIEAGPTAWDESGRIAGSCDLPLTPAGVARATDAAKELVGAKLSVIIAGPDEASRQTAEVVAGALEAAGRPKVKLIAGLGEMCLGLWEGMRQEQLAEKCPTAYRQWREAPESVVVPEGETLEEAQERAVQALGAALNRVGGGAVAVVLRPIALALVRCWLDSVGLRNVWSMVSESHGPDWRTLHREQFRRPAAARVRA